MKHLTSITAALGAALFLSQPADAGQKYGMTFNCVTTNNVPNCYGSLRAANASSGSTDYARFTLSQSGTLSFSAKSGSNTYACSFDSTSSGKVSQAVMSANYNLYFNLKIDSTAKCTNASFQADSAYQHLVP